MNIINKLGRNILTILASGWLLISPWVMSYHNLGLATWSASIVGVALILSENAALVRPGAWENVHDLCLGAYLICSPYLLGFASSTKVADNTGMIGLLVIGLAVIGLMDDPNAQRWWQDHIRRTD